MSRLDRTTTRLPRFYRHWKKDSVIYTLLDAISKQLDEADMRIIDLMRTRWVDTASGVALERLGSLLNVKRFAGETDQRLRQRIVRTVNEYKGGGTVSSIKETVSGLISEDEGNVGVIENPRVDTYAEFTVKAGDSWVLGSSGINDEQPVRLSITVEDEGSIDDPQIVNVETKELVSFKGKLKTGEQLIIEDQKAYVGEKDVSEKVSPMKLPLLLRKDSGWQYREAILEHIAVFDTAKFDEHTFAVDVPAVTIRFDWSRNKPAAILVKIEGEALRGSGVTQSDVKTVVDSIKASGVEASIEVKEER